MFSLHVYLQIDVRTCIYWSYTLLCYYRLVYLPIGDIYYRVGEWIPGRLGHWEKSVSSRKELKCTGCNKMLWYTVRFVDGFLVGHKLWYYHTITMIYTAISGLVKKLPEQLSPILYSLVLLCKLIDMCIIGSKNKRSWLFFWKNCHYIYTQSTCTIMHSEYNKFSIISCEFMINTCI